MPRRKEQANVLAKARIVNVILWPVARPIGCIRVVTRPHIRP